MDPQRRAEQGNDVGVVKVGAESPGSMPQN